MATYPAASTSQSDVAAAIALATEDGDIVTIPAGSSTWTTGVSGAKAIKIQGAWSGQLLGHSESSLAIGTGSKTFALTQNKNFAPQAGAAIRAVLPTDGAVKFMVGTVTSYTPGAPDANGTPTGTLIVNVTSVGGSGTYPFWTLMDDTDAASQTIINNNSDTDYLFSFTEQTTGSIELSGIRITQEVGGSQLGNITISPVVGGRPVLIHDCWMSGRSSGDMIDSKSNKGVFYLNSFDNSFVTKGVTGFGGQATAIRIQLNNANAEASWSTNSTFGSLDLTGRSNAYFEDNYLAAVAPSASDFDEGARAVVRRNYFDNSALTCHGSDTEEYGVRHVEVYDNIFYFNNLSSGNIFGIGWWMWQRGGTGLYTDNVMPDITSTDYGTQTPIQFSVMNVQRGSGAFECWLLANYPSPRQVGQGFGPGAVFHSFTSGNPAFGQADYYVFAEPVYIWDNTGGTTWATPGTRDDTDLCGNGYLATQWIQADRDYIVGTAKPSYVKFEYPHPLRSGSVAPSPGDDNDESGTGGSTTCFIGQHQDEQEKRIYEALGGDGTCWYSWSREERRAAMYVAAGGTEECFNGSSPEEQQRLLYEAFYNAAASTTELVDPSCFNGLSPDEKEYYIYAAASA